ncbi:ribokinase [Parabacteroides sp. PF5-5]|uniref:ribokinase n=1 Tax=unclassified Parabacteroides TaxID=2649774 RepID=UPI0024754631|nr:MULTISPECIES: ribokinase [unclassified Parabacteroides]MDH6315062.1 ribokinase [Parabacteroides sp. PF5-13]MDH6326413.1 ribokinase [Parabacteroides sp. PH5-41]MDH6334213.1 ribokinase [Parabacteroides sp. PF5-5]MDH6345117.1 ribokinase [Parabacteroides sp. PH5-46]MDH6360234.1 ribokinase [Parabacteroides sp. PH5-16]
MKEKEENIVPKKLLVVGSSNTDMVIKATHLPRPGETVLGGTFFMNPGGKGANQAVAAARLGVSVTFICKTGNDIFGHQANQLLEEEGIDTSYVFSDIKTPSGVALITVDAKAENCIVVASGANANLTSADLKKAEEAINASDIVLMQLEIPLETVEHVANVASSKAKKVILNPAPACPLSKELLSHLYLITPNETEAEMLSGIKIVDLATAKEAAIEICKLGVENVVITLGSKGALVYGDGAFNVVDAFKVEAVDTTAAGDVFNGALCAALLEGHALVDAVRFACKAASISVTRNGAQESAPYRNEIGLVINLK